MLRSSTTVEAPAFRPGNAAVEQRRGFSPGTKFQNYRRTPSRTTTIGRRASERTEPQNEIPELPTDSAPHHHHRPASFGAHGAPKRFPFRSSTSRPALTASRVLRSSTTVEAPAFRPGNAAVEQRRGFSPGTKFLNYRRTPSRTTTIGRRPSEPTEPQNVFRFGARRADPPSPLVACCEPALTASRVLRSSTTVEAPAFRPGNARSKMAGLQPRNQIPDFRTAARSSSRPALTAPCVLRSSTTVEAPAFRPGNAAVEQDGALAPEPNSRLTDGLRPAHHHRPTSF